MPTRFVLCTEDRCFPPEFMRRVVAARLGVAPVEIAAGHCVALSRPVELAGLLEDAGQRRRPRLRVVDNYDAELRRHNERLRAAAAVRPGDRVLDIGCGAGESTRDAARPRCASRSTTVPKHRRRSSSCATSSRRARRSRA